jgi:hypothetical protein
MILSQISRHVTLNKSILKTLLNSMSKRIRSQLDPSESGFISQHVADDDDVDDTLPLPLLSSSSSLDDSSSGCSSIENILMVIIILMRSQKMKFSENILRTLFVDTHPPYQTNFILLQYLNNLHQR